MRWSVPAVLVLLALALRLPGLGRASLWWDECSTLESAIAVAGSDAASVTKALLHGLSAYVLLLAPWATDLSTEWELRLPSLLAGIALVPVAFRLGRVLLDRRLAWRLGLAAALSPFFVWHAREARWYTLTWLLAGLALVHFVRALRESSAWDAVGCIGWGLAATLTYPPAAVPLVVEAGWIVLARARRLHQARPARRAPVSAIVAGTLLAVAGGIWAWGTLVGPVVREGAGGFEYTNDGGPRPAAVAYTAVAFTTGYTIGPGPVEWHARRMVWPTPREAVAMLAGALAMLLLAVRGYRKLGETGSGTIAAALVVLAATTIAATIAASLWSGHRYAPRHAGLACLPLLALAAAGTMRGGRGSRVGFIAGVVLVSVQAAALWNLHTDPRYEREAVRPAAAWVAGAARAQDIIFVFGGIDLPWRHYYRGPATWVAFQKDEPQSWTAGTVRDKVSAAGRVFVVRGLILGTPAEDAPLADVEGMTRLEEERHYPGIEVALRSSAR